MSNYRHLLPLFCLTSSLLGQPLQPFPLSQVRLGEGIFKDSMEVNRRVLDEIGVERALYCFRFNAKLATGDAKPLDSWASPEPGGAFPGFYESHYLSAISLMSAQTGDVKLRERVNYMVAELGKCQQALGGTYLFASPQEEFEPKRLDGVAWYRMHKLMEGLLAANRHAGNAQALDILNKLAAWIDTRMQNYGDQFEAVKKVEYGGMTEALENLYSITHNPRHHAMALAWEQRELMLDRFYKHEDFCEHANTLLAKMVGAARIAEIGAPDEYHRVVSENFWDLVAGSGQKTYATGGTSVHEGMPGVRALANTQSRMAQETCVSYNLLKVTRSLFHLTGEAKYMDYYERCLYNAILGSQDPQTGWKTYYQPLNANTLKDFRSNLTGCYCCNGTGLENPSQYGSTIYSHDDTGLRVNLFIASTVEWPDKGLQLKQITRFPAEPSTALVVQAKQPVALDIAIRVPAWCSKGFAIAVNGAVQNIAAKPGSFAVIKRTWKSGDRIDCKLPMEFAKYPMPDKKTQLAFMYGPLVMVGDGARPWLGELVGDLDDTNSWLSKLDTWFTPVKSTSLVFTALDGAGRELRVKPYYQIGGGQFFTGYWDIVKSSILKDDPNIALGKPTQCSCPDPSGVNVECFMRSGKAVDGQYGGDDDWYVKWFPNGMTPQWITVDLGEPRAITGIEWFLTSEDIKDKVAYCYKVESSNDNKIWQDYAGNPANTIVAKSYPHQKAVTARYMKLTLLPPVTAKDPPTRPKLAEFKIFGPAARTDKE
ncbi:MAG: beta-L-arabinofuranosidase domain-containing protein [Verrucomicrobiota bacterium]